MKEIEVKTASSFKAGTEYGYQFVPEIGVVRTTDGVPQAIQVSATEEVLWANVPEDIKAKVLEHIANPPSRGTVQVMSVDAETNTVYVGAPNQSSQAPEGE